VAGYGSNRVVAIDTSTRKILWKSTVPRPHSVGITPDGHTAYAASQQEGRLGLVILDVRTGGQRGAIPLNHTPRALAVSPDGEEVFFTEADVDAVFVLDRATNEIITGIAVGASPHVPIFTPDGKLGMVVAQRPGELDLFDPHGYQMTREVKFGSMPHWVAATRDSQFAYVTNEQSDDVSLVDLRGGKVMARIPVGKAPRKIVLQPISMPS
jgi:YVTN family beta-propeller protein